jgi:hypothetical protein
MATRGRRVVLAAGAVTVLALLVAAFQWRPLAVHWYTARLEGEPDLLLDLCMATPGSPGYEAVREFVRTAQGKKRVTEAYLEAVAASDHNLMSRLDEVRTYKDGAWLLLWLQGSQMNQMSYHSMPGWSFRGGGSEWGVERRSYRGRPLVPLLSAVQALVIDVGYDRYSLPGDAELTLSVVARREGEKDILGSSMSWEGWTAGHVALIENVRHQWPRERP